MEKFTKVTKDMSQSQEQTEPITQIKNEMAILPYFKEDGFILLKYENFSALNNKEKTPYQLSCIRGDYNDKETESQNLRRILFEKTGIVLNNMFSVDIDNPFFKDVDNQDKYYVCLLELNYNDYKQSSVKQTSENKIVRISLGEIDDIRFYDLLTNYIVLKLKHENNIK